MNLNFLHHTLFQELLSINSKILKPGVVFFGHGVTKKPIDPDIQHIQLSYEDFVMAIEFIENLNFHFISMEKFQELATSKSKVNYPWVLLTFDDGYKNNLTEIYPYLKQKGIPFTIFASVNHIIDNKRFDNYLIAAAIKHTRNEQLLLEIINALNISYKNIDRRTLKNLIISQYKYFSVEKKKQILSDICELLDNNEWDFYNHIYESEEVLNVDDLKLLDADPLVYIGSHGCNHYIQTTLTENERMFELQQSSDLLQQLLGKKQTSFCYPNGTLRDFSPETKSSCQKAGYSFCFTTIPNKWKPQTNLMEIPRYLFNYTNLPQALVKALFTY